MITPLRIIARNDQGLWEVESKWESLSEAYEHQEKIDPTDGEPYTVMMTHSMFIRWLDSGEKDALEYMKQECVRLWGSELPPHESETN